MRTTLNLDPDVLQAAKLLASRQRRSLGEVISELARSGLRGGRQAPQASRNGIPLFPVPPDAPVITLEDVKRDEDEAW